MHYADLVIVFSTSIKSLDKSKLRENAKQAQDQYTRLTKLLINSGLHSVGKRGRKQGDLLVLIRCSERKLEWLATRERELDFLHGIPVSTSKVESVDVSPADRIRLIHSFITCSVEEGGLGVAPLSTEWNRVQCILALHDPGFDARWIRSLTRGMGGSVHLDKVKDHYGEGVGLYFAFLSTYTKSLTFISAIGALFRFSGCRPYSPYYSAILLIWSTFFVEYWNICQRKISVRWRTKGVSKVEKRRIQYNDQLPEAESSWLMVETRKLLRIAISLLVLLGFVLALVGLLTGIFTLEAFVAIMYKGPGSQFAQLAPTVLYAASVPILLTVYRAYAIRVTNSENHKYNSTHNSSLTIKRFALSTLVSYMPLALSAFVYLPFGMEVLSLVHVRLHDGVPAAETVNGFWEQDVTTATRKLDVWRLQNQMFTFTVTAQIGNAFQEIGLPFIIRALQSFASRSRPKTDGGSSSTQEEEFLERIRREVALGLEYDVFEDYSEMVTQFGYVAIWSSIWPLAPVMALLNNWIESRSDAFKITVHLRRPIPIRTSSIGPWLECLRSITWVAVVINALLVCLFSHRFSSSRARQVENLETKFIWALLIVLAASHGYHLLQHLIKSVVERVFWRGCKEEADAANAEHQVKDVCLRALNENVVDEQRAEQDEEEIRDFWTLDEGIEEIRRCLKDV